MKERSDADNKETAALGAKVAQDIYNVKKGYLEELFNSSVNWKQVNLTKKDLALNQQKVEDQFGNTMDKNQVKFLIGWDGTVMGAVPLKLKINAFFKQYSQGFEICPVNKFLYIEGLGKLGDAEMDLTFEELHHQRPYPREIVLAIMNESGDPMSVMRGMFFDGKGTIMFNEGYTTNFETFHLSCKSSDVRDWTKDIGGIIIYTDGLVNGIKFRGGYVIIQTLESLKHIQSSEGIIHGKLFKSLFGKEPSQLPESHMRRIREKGRRKMEICLNSSEFWKVLISRRQLETENRQGNKSILETCTLAMGKWKSSLKHFVEGLIENAL
ncbi:hypothetical protein FGO68_gene10130 [Halteria grandinella]|uniref:Uncharacterized protein n=1 Tax=Halteria grandinella TaxID=5974 RepID=A0A8J8NNE7_HALGN|nr:hypothetical protein FGO68_gene10130 [Halteria grandinella]